MQQAVGDLGEGDSVIVDGTLIPMGRTVGDGPYYSHKQRKHGMNVQVVARPGRPPTAACAATPAALTT